MEYLKQVLSVPENVKGAVATGLAGVVVLATTAMVVACPHVLNYCLGVAVMISGLVLAKMK